MLSNNETTNNKQSVNPPQHTLSPHKFTTTTSSNMIQDLQLNLNRLDEEEFNLLLLKSQLVKIKKITDEKNKKDEMIHILSKRISSLEYEKDIQTKNNHELNNIITERIETLESLIVEKDLFLLQIEQQMITSDTKYDTLKKEYDYLVEMNRNETESHLNVMKINDENKIEIISLQSKIQQNEKNIQHNMQLFDTIKGELHLKEVVISQEKTQSKKNVLELSSKLLASKQRIKLLTDQILDLESTKEDVHVRLHNALQQIEELKATNHNLMFDLDKWTKMYSELEHIMKTLKQQITISQHGYNEELVDIRSELTMLRQDKIELDVLRLEYDKCVKELQSYQTITKTISHLGSMIKTLQIPSSSRNSTTTATTFCTQNTLQTHRIDINTLTENVRRYHHSILEGQSIATQNTLHLYNLISEYMSDILGKAHAYIELLVDKCNLSDRQEDKYTQVLKELTSIDTFIDSINYKLESMNLLFQINTPIIPSSTAADSVTMTTLNHINEKVHHHISNMLDYNSEYKIHATHQTPVGHSVVGSQQLQQQEQQYLEEVKTSRLKSIEHLRNKVEQLFVQLETNKNSIEVIRHKDIEYHEQLTNAKSDLSQMKDHYGSELIRLQQLSDDALHAVEITEYEAKNELQRLKLEYQTKFDDEVNRYEDVIDQLEKENKSLENAMINNKNKLLQAQDIISSLEDSLRVKEREVSKHKAMESKQLMVIEDLEILIDQLHCNNKDNNKNMIDNNKAVLYNQISNNTHPSRSSQLLYEIHNNLLKQTTIPSSNYYNNNNNINNSNNNYQSRQIRLNNPSHRQQQQNLVNDNVVMNNIYNNNNNDNNIDNIQVDADDHERFELDLSHVSKESSLEYNYNINNNNNNLNNSYSNHNNSYESTLASAATTAYLQRHHLPFTASSTNTPPQTKQYHHIATSSSLIVEPNHNTTNNNHNNLTTSSSFSPELLFSPTFDIKGSSSSRRLGEGGFNTHWKKNRIDISIDSNNTSTTSTNNTNNNTTTPSLVLRKDTNYYHNNISNITTTNTNNKIDDAYEIYSDIGKLTRKIESSSSSQLI